MYRVLSILCLSEEEGLCFFSYWFFFFFFRGFPQPTSSLVGVRGAGRDALGFVSNYCLTTLWGIAVAAAHIHPS